jgi:hypothetical protein
MGYRVDRHAVIELPPFEGTEVRVRIGMPIGVLREWAEAGTLEDEWKVLDRHGVVESWNLEDADGPIAVADALERVPMPELRALMRAWYDAAVNPPAPLPAPSSDTATSPAE